MAAHSNTVCTALALREARPPCNTSNSSPFCRLPPPSAPLLICPNPSPPPPPPPPPSPPPSLRRFDLSVWLHVYDLEAGVSKILNHLVRDLGTGAYHAGVEVFQREYYFGQTSDGSTGICMTSPRRHPVHAYRESIHMGRANVSEDEFNALVVDMRRTWPGTSYDLLSRNCLNFADYFCQALGVGRIPEWIMSMQVSAATAANHIVAAATALQGADDALGVTKSFKAIGSFLWQQNEEYGISTRIQRAAATGWNLIHSPYDGLSTDSESDNEGGAQYARVALLVDTQFVRGRDNKRGENEPEGFSVCQGGGGGGIVAQQTGSASSGSTCRQGSSTCRQVVRRGYSECTQLTSRRGERCQRDSDSAMEVRQYSTEYIEGISTGASSDIDHSSDVYVQHR
eukprot:GHVS01011623.1.p1 GENE.GHVS01011623.1~~GHVS01011623.1.p1  ORF type:complete len:464 (-),score=97.52 GHVS01011623.1:159-1352(-)